MWRRETENLARITNPRQAKLIGLKFKRRKEEKFSGDHGDLTCSVINYVFLLTEPMNQGGPMLIGGSEMKWMEFSELVIAQSWPIPCRRCPARRFAFLASCPRQVHDLAQWIAFFFGFFFSLVSGSLNVGTAINI